MSSFKQFGYSTSAVVATTFVFATMATVTTPLTEVEATRMLSLSVKGEEKTDEEIDSTQANGDETQVQIQIMRKYQTD